jgi:mannitol-1-/sugar-/sorbitol-6-phosphatase
MSQHKLFPGRLFAAFLFDADGTLIDSIEAANRVWRRWALSHGLDPESALHVIHGRRVAESIRLLKPEVDIERESAIITAGEIADVEGVVAIKGAREFVGILPPERWAIVTSAPRALALKRLGAAGIPLPRVLVTAEDVTQGKPAPDCFLQAARLLDVAPESCLVWEDTAAGIAAAEAAGAAAVVVSATHESHFETNHPVIVDYEGLSVITDRRGNMVLSSR